MVCQEDKAIADQIAQSEGPELAHHVAIEVPQKTKDPGKPESFAMLFNHPVNSVGYNQLSSVKTESIASPDFLFLVVTQLAR